MRVIAFFLGFVALVVVGTASFIIWVLVRAPRVEPPPRISFAEVRTEPEVLDLGVIAQCGPPIAFKVKLVNPSERTYHLSNVIAACGCTVPDLDTPLRLDPGESHEFLITLDPWSNDGPRKQRVDFIYAEVGRAPSFHVAYDVQSPITTRPGAAHRTEAPQLVLRLTAHDGEEFLIERAEPEVFEPWITTPTVETHVSLDWALVDKAAVVHPERFEFDEQGRWKRGIVTITTSRPECRDINVRVYNRGSVKAGTGFGAG
ncbi:MAG: DUF1573 domain-containing protein [Phycisphaeraceae bacterium]|nr:DUF1573 domain-containing protein [Phycisphaeraceae bacterium]